MNAREPEKHSVSFMLAEFATLQSLRADISSTGESRVNFFLVTVSAAIAGLGLLSKSPSMQWLLSVVAGPVLGGLLAFGLVTLLRATERAVNMTVYARGLNRIRRYFVELDPDVADHLILPIWDDTPSFVGMGWLPDRWQFVGPLLSLEGLVAVVNSVVASVIVSANTLAIQQRWKAASRGSAIAFMAAYAVQAGYVYLRLKKAEDQVGVNFPSRET
jgi:hypothetical protein